MIQRLYINGELVDMSEDTKITLNYKSNIFGDISKITASNSLTINIPKNTRNRRIFNNPTAPAFESPFRYSRHTCRYEQDGIELLKGYAVLLSSADTYEIALYWGVLTAYQTWVDANPTLQEIDKTSAVQWNSNSTTADYDTFLSSGYGFAHYDMRAKYSFGILGTTARSIHPSASVRWVINAFAQKNNITLNFPLRIADDLRRLVMPCTTMNAGERYWAESKLTATAQISPYSLLGGSFIRALDIVAPDYIETEEHIFNTATGNVTVTYFSTAGADKVRFTFKDFTANRYTAGSTLSVVSTVKDGPAVGSKSFYATTNSKGVVGFNISADVDVPDADFVYFSFNNLKETTSTGTWSAESFTYTPLVAQNSYPCTYDIAPNLPDISQIDLIKAVCAMFGLFAMPDPTIDNGITFVGIEDLLDNRANAYDWSANLLGERGGDSPEAQFSISEWAQENWFRYETDDSVNVDADAPLKVNNESLERKRDAVKLPFAPTDGNQILQYDVNVDDSGAQSLELRDVKPRIMRLYQADNGKALLRFNGLRFDEIIKTYYKGYSELLNSCVVVKEKLRLTEYDIRDLDFTRPVYLAQYGRYFGIVSLQVSGKECTAELALLPLK